MKNSFRQIAVAVGLAAAFALIGPRSTAAQGGRPSSPGAAAAAVAQAHVAFEAARAAERASVIRARTLARDVKTLIREAQVRYSGQLSVEQQELLGGLSGRVDEFLAANADLERDLQKHRNRIRDLQRDHRLSTALEAINAKPDRIPITDETYPLERLHEAVAAEHATAQHLLAEGRALVQSRPRDAISLLRSALAVDHDLDVTELVRQAEGYLPGWEPPERLFIMANLNLFVRGLPISETSTFLLYNRLGSSTVDYTYIKPRLGRFDGAVWARVWKGVALGGSVSEHIATADTIVAASVPSATSTSLRAATSNVASLARAERTVHLEFGGMWRGERGHVAVFAGPSRIDVEYQTITGFTVTELAGGSVRITPTVEPSTAVHVLGVHLLVDGAWMFSPFVGIGAMYRFTYAEDALTGVGGTPLQAKLGSSNVGWGLRVRF